MVSASSVLSSYKKESFSNSKSNFLSSDPNELCDKLRRLLQGKQAGNYSSINNEEIIAKTDKLLEYKCISTKQLRFLLLSCLN